MPERPRLPENIVVGVDGSLTSRAALRWAIEHARPSDTVTVLHVWSPSPSMVEVGLAAADDDAAARAWVNHEVGHVRALADDRGVHLESDVRHGSAEDVLCHIGADLLVVGACGRSSVAGRLLGSVSYYLARHCHRPLVIVPLHSPGTSDDESH